MKVTRILPRKLAIGWQEYNLARTDGELEYLKAKAQVLEEISEQGHTELRRLKGGQS